MTPKPQRKASLLHQQILGELLTIRYRNRTEHRPRKAGKINVVDRETGETYQRQQYVDVPVEIQVPCLAGNVSEVNIDRAAKRWAA